MKVDLSIDTRWFLAIFVVTISENVSKVLSSFHLHKLVGRRWLMLRSYFVDAIKARKIRRIVERSPGPEAERWFRKKREWKKFPPFLFRAILAPQILLSSKIPYARDSRVRELRGVFILNLLPFSFGFLLFRCIFVRGNGNFEFSISVSEIVVWRTLQTFCGAFLFLAAKKKLFCGLIQNSDRRWAWNWWL